MTSIGRVTVRHMGMMAPLLGDTRFVMFRRVDLAVVTSSVFVVLGCFGVVFGALMLHGYFLLFYSWEEVQRRCSSDSLRTTLIVAASWLTSRGIGGQRWNYKSS